MERWRVERQVSRSMYGLVAWCSAEVRKFGVCSVGVADVTCGVGGCGAGLEGARGCSGGCAGEC